MTAFYYTYNGHGDVTQILTDGVVTSSYYYDAFGNVIEESGTDDNPYRYSGYYYDKESKLYYLNARFYDPETARFLQRDTYRGNPANALSLNLYSYCFNNPIKYFDPTGHVVSNADKANLTKEQQNAIAQCTAAWNAADKAGNEAGKAAAHAAAEAIRNSAGYSGGSDGSGYISTPKTTSTTTSSGSSSGSGSSSRKSSGSSKNNDVLLRASMESLGCAVEWDATTSTAIVYFQDTEVGRFTEGQDGVYIDSEGNMRVPIKETDEIIPHGPNAESTDNNYMERDLSSIFDTFNGFPKCIKVSFQYIELVSVIIFTAEYLMRLWTATFMHPALKPSKARLEYTLSFMAIIDILAILPFYIPFIIPIDLRVLRMIRLLRILRVLKVNRYTSALSSVGSVIKRKAAQLISSMLVVFVLMVMASVIMYNLEYEAQPEVFENAFSGLWWAIATVTTVGYGDIYPVTAIGKVLSSVISLLGIGLVAVPTGIISAGFMENITHEKEAEKDEKHYCPYCGKYLDK